jgi:hypothetical protein
MKLLVPLKPESFSPAERLLAFEERLLFLEAIQRNMGRE